MLPFLFFDQVIGNDTKERKKGASIGDHILEMGSIIAPKKYITALASGISRELGTDSLILETNASRQLMHTRPFMPNDR